MISVIVLLVGIFIAHYIYEYIRRKPMLENLNKRYILITGCDTGFGNALAKKLDLMGCPVFAACYTAEGAENLKKECSSRLTTLQLDVSKEESIKEAYEFVSNHLSKGEGLWGLVNNAGITRDKIIPIEYHTRDDFKEVLDINLLGMIDMCTTFFPLLKATKGRIVNMTSVAGRISAPYSFEYCAGKHGAESFSDGLRIYSSQFDVKVSIIEPGFFQTPITDVKNAKKSIKEGLDRLPQHAKEQLVDDFVDKWTEVRSIFNNKYMSTDVNLVVEAYVHGLLAVHPKKRYSVGKDAYFLWVPLSYLPSCISDFLITAGVIKPTKEFYKK